MMPSLSSLALGTSMEVSLIKKQDPIFTFLLKINVLCVKFQNLVIIGLIFFLI